MAQNRGNVLLSGSYSSELQLLIKRWIGLVGWWQSVTGHRIFLSDKAVSIDWIVHPDERCGDIEAFQILTVLEDYGRILPLPERNWWRWEEQYPGEIARRRKLHEDLVNAAQQVLRSSKELDEYAALIASRTNEEYLSRLKYQLPPKDGICWDMLVGPDVWKAAFLLANTENPYPANDQGHSYRVEFKTDVRRMIVKILSELKVRCGREIKPQALTVLCLLVAPGHFNQYSEDSEEAYPSPIYLRGSGEEKDAIWSWGGKDSFEVSGLLDCKGFKALAKDVGRDAAS